MNKPISMDNWLNSQKILLTLLVMVTLACFSMLALAAESVAGDKVPATERGVRDFNHMTTGFPLTGLHTTVECGVCHVGGVFKGTPRNCSGCHTQGMRVVATTKSIKHLVTNEPCEVCHTNTVTFFGAKYNHAKAVSGQCTTCHNGIIAQGKAASHTTGKKSTESCDKCHRTFAWSPATWNHTAGGVCSSCHNGSTATGKPSGHIATTSECDQCHNQFGWAGALGGAPASHSGSITASCTNCHIKAATTHVTGTTLHNNFAVTACKSCHNRTRTYAFSSAETKTLGSHEGSSSGDDCSKSGCHRPLGSRGTAYVSW